jgi:hypothetical protein
MMVMDVEGAMGSRGRRRGSASSGGRRRSLGSSHVQAPLITGENRQRGRERAMAMAMAMAMAKKKKKKKKTKTKETKKTKKIVLQFDVRMYGWHAHMHMRHFKLRGHPPSHTCTPGMHIHARMHACHRKSTVGCMKSSVAGMHATWNPPSHTCPHAHTHTCIHACMRFEIHGRIHARMQHKKFRTGRIIKSPVVLESSGHQKSNT